MSPCWRAVLYYEMTWHDFVCQPFPWVNNQSLVSFDPTLINQSRQRLKSNPNTSFDISKKILSSISTDPSLSLWSFFPLPLNNNDLSPTFNSYTSPVKTYIYKQIKPLLNILPSFLLSLCLKDSFNKTLSTHLSVFTSIYINLDLWFFLYSN